MIKPARENEILLDPTGAGIEFSWEDAGTDLYYVRVQNLGGTVLWEAITRQTRIQYGAESLLVPLSLATKFSISKLSPDTARNEVKFQGLGRNTSYRIIVTAIQTILTKGNLATATAITMRSATEMKFMAE